MTVTGLSLIKGALQDLGVLALGQTPAGAEADDGLEALNQLSDFLNLDRPLLYEADRTALTLTNGTGAYSIGDGEDIDIVVPDYIDSATIILDTAATDPVETPIAVLDRKQYAVWPVKTQEASPRAIFYEKSEADQGIVHVLPIPNTATVQLVLYTPGIVLATFDLNTSVILARGWALMLRANLALRLAPQFPMATVSRELKWHAAESRKAIARANTTVPMQRNDPALTGGRGYFDIDTATWR